MRSPLLKAASFLWRRSIARDLAFGLTTIIIIVTLILSISYQILSSRTLAKNTKVRAEQLINEAGDMFFLPLYNFDNKTLEHMARVYLDGNDFVYGITIQTERNEFLINHINGTVKDLFHKEKTLYAKGKEIGTVTLYFSDQKLRQQQRDTLVSALIVIIVLLMVILATIDLFMQYWLRNPLNLLTNAIRRIAAGDYQHPLAPAPQQEINAIIDEVNTMAGRIAAQQKQLEDSEKRYRSIFEGAIEGIFQETPDGTLLTANPAMAAIFGYSSMEELIQCCSNTSKQLYAQPQVRQYLIQELEKQQVVKNIPLKMRHKNGQTLTIAMTARLVHNEENNLLYIEGLLSDISQQQQLEAELRQAQKMEAIGTLAGGIAHDFNNILSALFGYLELAKMRVHNDKKLDSHLTNALAGAHRARDLVQQILTFSRKADQEEKPFHLALIIQEACKLIRSSIPATIEIHSDIKSQAVIIADPTQIHQVVMNLCANSYHAMEHTGGTLTIKLYDQRLQDPEDTLVQEGGPLGTFVILEITDTGCGIDKESTSKIFEPYFTTKKQGKGTGLGLALVHGIISNCHGKIEVKSTVGKGTTFRILLPAVDQQSLEHNLLGNQIPRGKGQKIMLVDDEEPVRDVLSSFLRNSGYTVRTFSRGHDILEALQNDPDGCELLITDLAMPNMTGTEIAREAMRIKPHLPVILCTGYSEDLSRKDILEVGIHSVIQKPLQRKEFLQAIYRVFG